MGGLLLGLLLEGRLQQCPVLLDALEAGVLDLEHPVQHVLDCAVGRGGSGGDADAHRALWQPGVGLLRQAQGNASGVDVLEIFAHALSKATARIGTQPGRGGSSKWGMQKGRSNVHMPILGVDAT